jgi:cytochrome c
LRRRAAWIAALAAPLATGVLAQAPDRLIPGPGSTLTENKCAICHELEHIRRARLSRGEWADNIRNMRERGAPLTDDEVKVVLDYLATYYNREKPAPAPSADTLAAGGTDPVQKALNANGCTGCHAPDSRVVGPSFREIGAKYAGDAAAPARLAAKIRAGSQGTWGAVPMPPNPNVSDADLAAILGWLLPKK